MITLLVVLALGLGPVWLDGSSCHRSECGVMGAGGLEGLLVLVVLEVLGDGEGEGEGEDSV